FGRARPGGRRLPPRRRGAQPGRQRGALPGDARLHARPRSLRALMRVQPGLSPGEAGSRPFREWSSTMRHPFLLAAAIALLPAPALAAPDYEDGELSDTAKAFADPQRQEELAGTMRAVMEAMLEMPAAPLLRAAATVAGEDPEAVHPDTRVADLAGPEAAEAPREVAEKLPQMMGA